MIYLIYGEDRIKTQQKLHALVEALQKKRPGAEVFSFSKETFSMPEFTSLIEGSGLFEAKYIIVLDNILKDKNNEEKVRENIDTLSSAEHAVVFVENELKPSLQTFFKKHAMQVYDFPLSVQLKKEFNVFLLSDALGMRDKKNMWMLLMNAFEFGVEPEEIHGIFLWQIKSMLLVKTPTTEDDRKKSGIKPFVVQKAKRYSMNYSLEELQEMSSKLVKVVGEVRRGNGDFKEELERFVLGI